MNEQPGPIFIRAFPLTVERREPHRLLGRLVPYNLATDVADPTDDPNRFDFYQEGFRPGAFQRQLSALRAGDKINKIKLVHTHEGGLGTLGVFTNLSEESDGLYGDARIYTSKVADVTDLLETGDDELSVEFRLHRSNHTVIDDAGVRWRTGVHLDRVALEPKGAYSGARVLAFRNEMDEIQREQAAEEEAARAAAEAEAQQQAEAEAAEAAAAAEAHQRAEAEVEAAAEKHRRWEEMRDRFDGDLDKQKQYVRDYGITQPGGLGSQLR
jgi:HK97 family phage prohead protease